MCTGVLYLRVSQTVRRGRALPEGDFRKDCATAAGGGSGQTFLPDEVEGHTIHWEQRRDQRPEKILILGVILACFVPVVSMSRKQEEQKSAKCFWNSSIRSW